jgi:hypothetical protein
MTKDEAQRRYWAFYEAITFGYVAMTKDEAQRRYWAFYEAITFHM